MRYNINMREGKHNGHNSPGTSDGINEIDNEFIPDDARPVCAKCFRPCWPLQNYCDKCDSNQVINPLAAYMPFVNIRFNYDIFLTMWRKIWYGRKTPVITIIFYLLIMLWFAPVLIVVGPPAFLIGKIKNPRLQKVLIAVFLTVAAALLTVILLRQYIG